MNNGGRSYEHKEGVRQLFLDMMEEPQNSIRRTRPDGMYTSYYLDDAKLIKLILLDNRYSSDEKWRKDIPNDEKCNLGAKQREWLKTEVMNSKARYTLIGAGISILPESSYSEKFYKRTREFLIKIHNPKTSKKAS